MPIATRPTLLPLLMILALGGPTQAETQPAPQMTPMRGTVVARDGDDLTVKPETGSPILVRMDAKTKILMAQRATVRDIKPESYISVVTTPIGAAAEARTVTIHSPSERGLFAGRRPWDGANNATLTGGWVETINETYPRQVGLQTGGVDRVDHKVTIAEGTPTTQIMPGEKALLVEGAAVSFFTHPDASNPPIVELIAVGRQGATPTL